MTTVYHHPSVVIIIYDHKDKDDKIYVIPQHSIPLKVLNLFERIAILGIHIEKFDYSTFVNDVHAFKNIKYSLTDLEIYHEFITTFNTGVSLESIDGVWFKGGVIVLRDKGESSWIPQMIEFLQTQSKSE